MMLTIRFNVHFSFCTLRFVPILTPFAFWMPFLYFHHQNFVVLKEKKVRAHVAHNLCYWLRILYMFTARLLTFGRFTLH